MSESLDLLREGRHKDLWAKCCGFIDLDIEQFMTIQRRRLEEQIRLLADCELGQRLFRDGVPYSVEEFRETVPLTTYADYIPYVSDRMEDTLPEKPALWQQTSGRPGLSGPQLVPVSRRMYQEIGDVLLAILIFATCNDREDIAFEMPVRFLYGMAPPPYATGTWGRRLEEEDFFAFLPPLDEAESMSFEDRLHQGFKLALATGLDVMFGTSSVMVALGERFGQSTGLAALWDLRSQPTTLLRLGRALLRSKLARRSMLPKDVWSIKGLAAASMDAHIYGEQIRAMWGRYPLSMYGRTEASVIAMQTWDYQTMTFVPQLNFLEFIPEGERLRLARDPTHRPRTLLLDEVQPGENYELVITNFLGGPFARYRIGDIVSIASLRNERVGIALPQMAFVARAENIIDIAGFTRLTEETIGRALDASGIAYEDWTARREVNGGSVLHLYIALSDGAALDKSQVVGAVHQQLKALDADYAALEDMLGLRPLDVTLLPGGAFARYAAAQRGNGGTDATLPHLNPSDAQVQILLDAYQSS